MTYREQLHHWVVVRSLPNFQHVDVARFYKYSDAEGYLRTVRQLRPIDRFEIMFDPKAGEEGDR
jgi:hypothetical protein